MIRDNGEPNVVQYTFELLYKELKDIPGSELLIRDNWNINDIKNLYVCFVEADCLVSPGYFKKQLEKFKTLSHRVVMLSAPTAVNKWDNKIYGYSLDIEKVIPNRKNKANRIYPIQIAYIPGSIIRTVSLKKLFKSLKLPSEEDLTYYSSYISINVWKSGITHDDKHPDGQLGSQININPGVVYATTESYINDMFDYMEPIEGDLLNLFMKESI